MTGSDVPLTRPKTGPEELAAVERVLASGWLAGQGPEGTELEAGFRVLTGRSHAIAVNNCTAGLHLVLAGLGVGPGDEVLVSDYTFPATAHAVLYCGATPTFVDVRPDTATIDVERLEAAVTPRTRVVVGVDALGMPADWAELEEFAVSHDLLLVADAACSAGSVYRDQPCGAFGDVAVFSLHARKGITCGEGGVVVTDNEELAQRIRRMANFGMQSAFDRHHQDSIVIPEFVSLGYNYKLADLLAGVASAQLAKLEDLVSRRRLLAQRYHDLLAPLDGVEMPHEPKDRASNWQTYAVRVDPAVSRDRVASELRRAGIGATIGTYALSLQPVYGASEKSCPRSAALFSDQLALPMYVDLTKEDQDRVVRTLRRVIESAPRG